MLLIVTKDQFKNVTLGDILFADLVVVSYQFLTNPYYQNLASKVDLEQLWTSVEKLPKEELLNNKAFTAFHLFQWNCVFLDEAHEIQNQIKANAIKTTIHQISSLYKWNITGTPFANGLDSFLNLTSYNTNMKSKSNTAWMSVFDLVENGINCDFVRLWQPMYRCNTKQSVKLEYQGNIIREQVHLLEFTSQERNIYDSHLQGVRSKYSDFLIRLCCHSELFNETRQLIQNCKTFNEIQHVMLDFNKRKLDETRQLIQNAQADIEYYEHQVSVELEEERKNDWKAQIAINKRRLTNNRTLLESIQRTFNFLKHAVESLRTDIEATCPICLDTITEMTITKCGHKFCWDCLQETFNAKQQVEFKCPTCNQIINTKEIYLVKPEEKTSENKYNLDELNQIINAVKSTKVGHIIHFLKNKISEDDKVILFSQWDELLHKVGGYLQAHGLKMVYCNGTVYQRKRAISNFNQHSDVNIIMLSSRNAASGINLTAANQIILLEPVYGTQEYRINIESQAIGRADRIGQKRPIQVHRFIIKDTIEEDIINNKIDDTRLKQLTG